MEKIFTAKIYLPEKIRKKILAGIKNLNLGYYSKHKFEPHFTIHLSKIFKKNFKFLISDIENLKIKPFSLKIDSIQFEKSKTKNNLFIFARIQISENLLDIHKKIVILTNKYCKNLIRKIDKERIKKDLYSKKEIEYIKKYGYPRIFDLFHSHITLGECEFEDKNIGKIKEKLRELSNKIINEEFLVNKINLILQNFEYNRDKSIYEKIKEVEIILK